ncbi:MAG: DMT family transporter [Oscillospiraceae bacterium]|nr:DMT family transporter [Oscillospiraceae bacterium]
MIFGFAMVFMKTAMNVVGQDAVKFLAFRFTLGFAVLSLMLLLGARRVSYKGKPVWLLFLCGALNPLVSQVMETSSVTYAPTAQIAVFLSLIPILVVVLSVCINREKPTRRQIVFMGVSVSGMLIINFAGGNMGGGSGRGIAYIVIALVVISFARVFIRRASTHFTAFETIYVTTGMGAVGFSIVSATAHAARGGGFGDFFAGLWVPGFVVPVLYMGICSCVVAFLCMTYAVGRLPIAVSASTSTLNTVVAILAGVFILGESLRAADVVGAAVILGGIVGMGMSYDKADTAGNRYKAPAKSHGRE